MSLIILAILWLLAVVVPTVYLEDTQEVIQHYGGGIYAGWDYADPERWRNKYPEGGDKDGDGIPYEWEDRKWWARVGLAAFGDLWHLAKTLRVILFCAVLVDWVNLKVGDVLPWWTILVVWGVYGSLHDRVFHGKLLKG